LDVDGVGYLDEATLIEALSSTDRGFRDKEIEDMLREAKNAETGLIYYHKYVDRFGVLFAH